MKWSHWIERVVRAILAWVLIASAAGKIGDELDGVVGSTLFSAVLPSIWLRGAFCVIEVMIAIGLLSGFHLKVWLVGSLTLFLFFCGFLSVELLSEAPRACGCSGSHVPATTHQIRWELAIRLAQDVMFAIACGSLWVWSKRAA